jgi:hypothetical protein
MRLRLPVLLAATVLLGACATTGEPAIPNGAVESTRTLDNGDVVAEYRVQGQLTMVRVQPKRGPVYYLIDSNGDGRLDSSKGEGPISPVYYRIYGW